ncbi:YdcP family protein [Shouchella clausii]|uniref:YdcP family protein n=1 Tax=Shouchella clausii TaxID=79880 RepID=UPI0026F41E69|nr:YdcP family protein [Shouchella clausii]MDO7284701.1 YdcP family protein [Shouchella clausii]MDO7304796.1 YdcP family protein [Shouchella clausii]
MKFNVGITPDVEMTFGELFFMGLDRERYYYDREKGERTNKLEARVYNVASSVQGEQLQVEIPEYVDLKEIKFNSPVQLKNPILTARAQANGNFANVIWTIKAEDIIEGVKSFNKKTEHVKEPALAGSDKK